MRRWATLAVMSAVLLAAAPAAAGTEEVAASAVTASAVAPPAAAAAPAAKDPVHEVTAFVVRIGTQASDGVTADQIGSDVELDVAPYFGDSTGWAVEFRVVSRWMYTTPSFGSWGSMSTCTDTQVARFLDWAEQTIASAEGPFGPQRHAVVYTPRVAACDFDSTSEVGQGGVVWVNGQGEGQRWMTIAHELGHNLGLGDSHSRLLCGRVDDEPTAADGLSSQCVEGYRGDAYDVMGYQEGGAPGLLNAAHLDTLGLLSAENTAWMDGTEAVVLESVGRQTDRRFAAFRTNLATYYVEYRSPLGRDAGLEAGRRGCPYGTDNCSRDGMYYPGLVVHRVDAQGIGADSYLLDAPAGDPDFDWARGKRFLLPSDYTFTTANGVISVDFLLHDEYRAQVRVTMPSIPIDQIVMSRDLTGDGKGDVVTVDSEGTMYLYAGAGTGGLGAMRAMPGSWKGLQVFAPGDWNGDKRSDLVVVDGSGDLWLFAGRNNGTFAGRVQVGFGWTGYRIVPAGDMNGDGINDLLAMDAAGRLWLYPGAGSGAFGRRVQVGSGWNGFQLYAAGDSNRDGRNDILSVDDIGRLWYYSGRGGGFFNKRAQVGYGWSGYEFASGADLNRDGLGDLLGRDRAGTLFFYPGRVGSGFGKRVAVANGW